MSMQSRLLCCTAVLAMVACSDDSAPTGPDLQTSVQSAQVQSGWPSGDDPGPPYYVRIEPQQPHVYATDDWAVFVFYRDPACVRPEFNLLAFFDPPAAFACPATVTGSSLWHDAVGTGAPKSVRSTGAGAVPVWFVPSATAATAVSDGVLTIGELEALPGRVAGEATFLQEVLHPHPLPMHLGGGGHPSPKLVLTASGITDDGREFRLHTVRRDVGETRVLRLSID